MCMYIQTYAKLIRAEFPIVKSHFHIVGSALEKRAHRKDGWGCTAAV